MAFYHRAKSMYDRGEVVRAATILAEGLKREPGDVESLEWLLHLYVKEIPNPGLEVEMVKILAAQANGRDLLEIVQSELEAANMSDKIRALDNVRRREGVLMDPPTPVHRPAAPVTSAPLNRPSPTGEEDEDEQDKVEESWQSFSDPTDEIAQVQARTPAPRTAPIPSPVSSGESDAPRPASTRSTRPLPPLDDPSDELDDSDDDVGRTDAQRPVLTWVIVGVATALLVLALVMALMRGSETTDTAPAGTTEESEGSAGATRSPMPASWSIA
jgi:hypothetical protein